MANNCFVLVHLDIKLLHPFWQKSFHSIFILNRWNKLVQRPYDNGDPRGMKLVKAILRPLMLRRTKESKDKEGR